LADLLFSVGADLSGLTADLGRLRQLVAQIRLPTGLESQIKTIADALKVVNTQANSAGTSTGRAAAGLRNAGDAGAAAGREFSKLADQIKFVIKNTALLERARVGDLGLPKAAETFDRFARTALAAKDALDAGKTATAQSGVAFKQAQIAVTELETAMKRLGDQGLSNVRALNDQAKATLAQQKEIQSLGKLQSAAASEDSRRTQQQLQNAEKLAQANREAIRRQLDAKDDFYRREAEAAQRLGKLQSAASADDARRTQEQLQNAERIEQANREAIKRQLDAKDDFYRREQENLQRLGKLQSAASVEDERRIQAAGRLQAKALSDNQARLDQAQKQAQRLNDQLSKFQGLTFGAPKGSEEHINKLREAIAKIGLDTPLAKRELNALLTEGEKLYKLRGVSSVFNDLGTSMLRAVKVGLQFTLIYGGLRAAIGGAQELVQLDKQMTNIASTITDAGQRAKTLPVAFDLTREAMTSLGLSAEKAGGLVFELQKVFDGNAELMRAAFVPALVLTANKEADQAETVRVLVGAYNLYGDTLQGAGTAQEKFAKISDMLLKSSFLSVASVGDLATALGSVAATGRQSGVSFSQLLGTLVVLQDSLRKSGQSGAGLNRTFEALLENAQNAATIFDVPFDIDKGVKPFELLLDVLEQINKEVAKTGTPTERLAQRISQAFPTIQSRQTILTLASQTDRIREVAREAEAAAGVTQTAFGEMQKALGAAASSLANEFLTAFANVVSAIGGDTPGKFEGIAAAIRTIAEVAREAGDSLATVIKGLNLVVSVGAGVIDVAKSAGEAASGFVTGTAERSAQGEKRIRSTGRGLLGKIRALGLDPFDPDIANRTEIGREWEAEFKRRQNERELKTLFGTGPERLGPFLDAQGANTARIIQETTEQPSERIRRLTNDAVNEIFEESQRSDPTRPLPDRLQDAIEQQQKSEALLRQGRAAPGRLGKDEASQLTALRALARDAAEDQKRVLAIRREIADFDARNFVENKKRQEELFQSQLKLNDELKLRTIETLPGGAEEKFTARLDFETQAEIEEVEKRVKSQQDYANAVVAITAIRDEKLRQFRIQNENAEIESFTRQFEAYRQTTESEEQLEADKLKQTLNQNLFIGGLNGEDPADTIRKTFEKGLGADKLDAELRQMVATLDLVGGEATEAGLRAKFMSAAFRGVLEESQLKQLEEIIKRVGVATEKVRLQKFREENAQTTNQINAAAAAFGLVGEEADRASLAFIQHGKAYHRLNEEQRAVTDQTAKVTAEFRQQQAVLSLISVGFDEVTASMIAQRNEASQKRLGQLEAAAKELKDFNEEAERTRDVMLEVGKQRARFEGDAVGFFIASLKKAAGEAGGFFKGLEDLGTDTARNLQSAFSDLFFDVFTNKAQSAAEVFKNFTNSMLRSISNFLANQLVQQLLSIFFPGAGGPQQLAGPTSGGLAGGLGGIVGSIKELFSGTGAAGTTVAQGPVQLAGPGVEGTAAVGELPTSTGNGLSGLLAALPAIGASATALGAMLGSEGSGLSRFGSLATALAGASTLFKSFQSGNLISTSGLAGIGSIAGAAVSLSGVGGQTGALAGNALSSLGLLAGGPGSGLAGGALAASTLINAYRSFNDPYANQGTGVGGAVGTAVGGAIGAYIGEDAQSAAIGAGIGGAIGEFIGSFFGKEGVSHAEREDRETAATIEVAIAFQKSIESATSAVDLFNKLVEGTVDSDGRGDDTPIVTRVGGVDIRELSPQQLLDAVTKNPQSLTADIIAGVAPEKLADAEAKLAETIRSLIKALDAVKTGLARFGEIAINLSKDSGTLLDLEEPKGAFEQYRESLKDVDEELDKALTNVSGIPKNLDDIIGLVNKRYQLELDFLKEVNDAVKAIRESISDQRTDIELQFATPAEKVKIIQGQIDEVINSLRLATDPKEIAKLTQEGQGLVRDLLGQSGSLSDDFGLSQAAIKQTALNLLNQLEELSTVRLGDLSEAAREGDEEFVDFLLDSAQKMGLELNLTTEQLQGLAQNAARASEALIRLGLAPSGSQAPGGDLLFPSGFAQGGFVPGSGSGDIVRAMLEPGEFVMPKGPAAQHAGMLEMMRAMGVPQFAQGGYVPFWQRVFGNTNSQSYGEFYSNLTLPQKIATELQRAIALGSTFTNLVPGGFLTAEATAYLGRKSGLLPTYNTGSLFGDTGFVNPNSDRGLFTRLADFARDIGTAAFGTTDRLAPLTAGGGLSDYLRSGAGASSGASAFGGGFSDATPFFSGPPSLGGIGDFPFGFYPSTGTGATTRSTPTYAPSLSDYFTQAFSDFSVSGSGRAYPSGAITPFGGGSAKPVGGISDPYAFNIPYDASPLTYQALGFSPSSFYEGAIADRALATGSLFGSTFSAAYGATSPYSMPAGSWFGPGVTGNTFSPYRFAPGNFTMFGGQTYSPTGQQFSGIVSQAGNFSSYTPSYGGYSGGSSYYPSYGGGQIIDLRRYAEGGLVPGSGTGDTVPALLTPGEYVVPAGVAAANRALLESLSKTGIGTPTTTTASGARNTMTKAAGTALGSLTKSIGTTLVNAGTNAASQLGDANDQIAEALASATLVAVGIAMGGLFQTLGSGGFNRLPGGGGDLYRITDPGFTDPGAYPDIYRIPEWRDWGSQDPTTPLPERTAPTLQDLLTSSTSTGPFSLANSYLIPGLTMPTQESIDRLNSLLGGITGGGTGGSAISSIPPEALRFFLGLGYAEGGFIGSDNIPIWASAGEFVVPRYAAMANAGALEHLRRTGSLPDGQNVVFNLHFQISGAMDPEEVAEAVEKRIESSVRTGKLGVVIAERQKRKV
jgi:TP901 family phage tail tape measure protein